MNKTLWEEVLKFSFDDSNDEYGFSTRLALENHWTLYFTQNALLEYKKFMFLLQQIMKWFRLQKQ